MCLAIVAGSLNELDHDVPSEYICNAWQDNNDGAGFAYVNNGEVVVEKGFMRRGKFLRTLYKRRRQFPDSKFLIHLRWASRGEVNKDNTHPFMTHEGKVAFIHNGTISSVKAKKGESDTKLFGEMVADFPSNFDRLDGYVALMLNYIGTANKVAFLNNKNAVLILNSNKGILEDGIWYSNEYIYENTFRNRYNRLEWVKKVGETTPANDEIGDPVCPKCGAYLVFADEVESNLCFYCQCEDEEEREGQAICDWCREAIDTSDQDQMDCKLCESCMKYAIEYDLPVGGLYE